MELFLIDAIGPFFRGTEQRRVNWSKIPFADFQRGGRLDEPRLAAVAGEFDAFCARAVATGYNAVTLDDVAHLADSPDDPGPLRGRTSAGIRTGTLPCAWISRPRACGARPWRDCSGC